ncbi:MAG TPA: pitrilysin family protein [Gemmatimonadales bacterium]|nr:pitrilysin family protein [Gemmatimonadales bacterium]
MTRGRIALSVSTVLTISTALSALAAPLAAQSFDRSHPPELAPPAPLHLPTVEVGRLANGARIYLVEMHKVPLVQVTLRLRAGARYEGDHGGLASFTAGMLDEGAGSRDAAGIAAEAGFLGARLSTDSDWDFAEVSLNTPRRTLSAALDLMADVVLRPNFLKTDIDRERNLRIADLIQARSEPGSMADLAFNATVFPAGHPYHRSLDGDSASVAGLDSMTVRDFYRRTFQPDQAEFVVTGDITMDEAVRLLVNRFGKWRNDKLGRLTPAQASMPEAGATAVTLVDKPGAAQSVIVIGNPGVARTSPDYAALEVMNTLLGGSYSSRLNQNLREVHGYTYGAGSGFLYRPLPGPFEASAAVRTDVTDSSLIQFFREFRLIRDSQVTATELARATSYITLGLPRQFETTRQMAAGIGELLSFGLPLDYFNSYPRQIQAVTAGDVQRVARHYLDPGHFSVIVVGDVQQIRPGIEALGLGPVSVRNPLRMP